MWLNGYAHVGFSVRLRHFVKLDTRVCLRNCHPLRNERARLTVTRSPRRKQALPPRQTPCIVFEVRYEAAASSHTRPLRASGATAASPLGWPLPANARWVAPISLAHLNFAIYCFPRSQNAHSHTTDTCMWAHVCGGLPRSRQLTRARLVNSAAQLRACVHVITCDHVIDVRSHMQLIACMQLELDMPMLILIGMSCWAQRGCVRPNIHIKRAKS